MSQPPSIFSSQARRSPARPAAEPVYQPEHVAERSPIAPLVDPALDACLISLLEAPPRAGETVAAAFGRKEAELREVFGALALELARALHHRLASCDSGDPVVVAFHRLTDERRKRLIGFLSDARRRAAIAPLRR